MSSQQWCDRGVAKAMCVITLQYIRVSKNNSLYTLSLLAPCYISTGGKKKKEKKKKDRHVTRKWGLGKNLKKA